MLGIIAILLSLYAVAQKPETIPSFARNPQEISWYKQQSKAWQKLIDENPKDANAWYNYYAANRILNFHDKDDKRSHTERDEFMKDLVNKMGKQIPESYEYNFCTWQLNGNDMKYYSFLEKAIAIDPSRTEHIDYMINIGELTRNMSQRNSYSLRKHEVGQSSVGMNYYNYNVLTGLETNAVLITAGDNDTYPAWYLQAKGIRKDVKVLNLYLLGLDDYREKICKELGIKNVTQVSENDVKEFRKVLLKEICEQQKYPVYFGLTAMGCDEDIAELQEHFYLCGLSYKYSKENFDNMAILKNNFENKYALDYLDKAFYTEPSESRVKEINRNYIVPMVKLYQHYKASGDVKQQTWIKGKLMNICDGTEEEAEVLQLLNKD